MATFHFELVSPEKLLFSGEVEAVVVPGTEGLSRSERSRAGHDGAKPGMVEIDETPSKKAKLFVRGGFADVANGGLTILAEQAKPLEELEPRGAGPGNQERRGRPRRREDRRGEEAGGRKDRPAHRAEGSARPLSARVAPAPKANPAIAGGVFCFDDYAFSGAGVRGKRQRALRQRLHPGDAFAHGLLMPVLALAGAASRCFPT